MASATGHATEPRAWRHEREFIIPFAGPPGHYRRISYAAVLRGEVPPDAWAGHIVLVGATAAGLGDSYPTPVSGSGVAMPGVELMAGVIDALQQGLEIREPGRAVQAAVSVLLTLGLLAALAWLSPRAALLASAAAAAGVLLAAWALLRFAGVWPAPSAALVGMLAAYPLWSWRRLEAAARYLEAELRRHDEDADLAHALLPAAPYPANRGRARLQDVFARRIGLAHSAVAALRRTRAVFAQSLAGLPVAVLVCDPNQRIFLANHPARAQLRLRGNGERVGERLGALQAAPRTDWHAAIARTLADGSTTTLPLVDRDRGGAGAGAGHAWQVSIAPYARVGGETVGAIVTLMDVTELQRLQREEREFLQFLSHDLRAPQNAVLSLVDLARQQPAGATVQPLLERIERHAERALALIDALLLQLRANRLVRAELRPHDLAQALHEAADQLWPQAQARGQHLSVRGADSSAWVRANGELLQRAIGNLAVNASNYAGAGATLELLLRRDGPHWCCEVRDNGPGIAPEHQARLFERHYRVPRAEGDAVPGSGLGLAFVKTVAQRHGGSVDVASQPGRGSTFRLRLPALDDADEPA